MSLCTPFGSVGSMPSPGRPGTMGSNSRSFGDVGVGGGYGGLWLWVEALGQAVSRL